MNEPATEAFIPPLLVLIPSLEGTVCIELLGGLVACAQWVREIHVCAQCSDIRIARAILAHRFLHSEHSWALWLDADIGFTQEGLLQLFSAEHDPLVIGHYPRKGHGMDAGHTDQGFGFVRMHRSVLERLSQHCRVIEHNGQPLTDFFPAGPDQEGKWLGEDRAFFSLCRTHQIPVRIEQRCQLVHVGRIQYRSAGSRVEAGLRHCNAA